MRKTRKGLKGEGLSKPPREKSARKLYLSLSGACGDSTEFKCGDSIIVRFSHFICAFSVLSCSFNALCVLSMVLLLK